VSSPDPAFDAPARDWVRQARFRPARFGGQAVRAHVTIPLQYSLTRG
jgi:TonB family protein